MSTSVARIRLGTLTQKQYNNPEKFSPYINFMTSENNHPMSWCSLEDIPVGANIAFQKCNCKLVSTVADLKTWFDEGKNNCVHCQQPLNQSDLLTLSDKISKYLEYFPKSFLTASPLLAIIFNTTPETLSASRIYTILIIGRSAISHGKKIFENKLQKENLLKISIPIIELTLKGIFAVYAGDLSRQFFDNLLSYSLSKKIIPRIINNHFSWIGSIFISRLSMDLTHFIFSKCLDKTSNLINHFLFTRYP